MAIIYKYTLKKARNVIEVHQGAQFLHVDLQHGIIRVWALVNLDNPEISREFLLVGTGIPISDDLLIHYKHIGTVLMNDGIWVWHIFVDSERI